MVIERSHYTEYPGAITLPITTQHRQIAQRFVDQCPFSEKAPQIERNILAVCAVNAYLQMMEIETDVAASDSWNPMMQTMADVADLVLPGVLLNAVSDDHPPDDHSGIASLSCRAMLPEDETCYVPPEDWHSRAGYVAVVIDKAANQATLLGFTPTVDEATVDDEDRVVIAQFSPIETLLDHIHTLTTTTTSVSQTAPLTADIQTAVTDATTRISEWFEGSLTNGWQAIEELINPPQMGFAFRSSNTARSTDSSTSNSTSSNISRAKAITLEGASLDQPILVALIIQLSQVSPACSDIILQVRPLGNEPCLPQGISLSIFDDGNNLVRNATSRAIDNYIQLQVVGEPGESFSIQLRKEETTFEETFEI
ncbi:MAG: DUF1822 family protein [Cyanobacteria bacterium P01_D01_bin.105]